MTSKHLKAIEMLANPELWLTREEIASECGMHQTTLWRLLQKPEAQELLRARTDYYVALNRALVISALTRNAIQGDRNSVRDYLQMTGDIGSGNTQVVHVTQNNEKDIDERIDGVWRRRTAALAEDKD